MKALEWVHEVLKMANKAYSLQKTLDKSSEMGVMKHWKWQIECIASKRPKMKVVEWGHEVLKMANKAYSLQKTLDESSGMGPWSTENGK